MLSNKIKVAAVCAVSLAMLAPSAALAWSGYSQVLLKAVTVYQSGRGANPGALIELPTPFPSDTEGCAHSGQGYAWIDFSTSGQPDGKEVYASVLAAHLAGRSIGIGLNGCNSEGYPLVYGVNVY